MPAAERKRRHHHRSRNGCITCKQRHMRCDENKPYCRNCLKSGGCCGYSGFEFSNLDSPSLELTEERLQLQSWSPSPSESPLLPLRMDPFDALGATQSHKSNMLLHHYVNYRVLTRTPIRRRKLGGEAVDIVRSDEALLHTAILLAANHWIILGDNPATVSSALYHHKLEAIRIINDRLGDPARAGLIGTVGAVAALTLSEVICGNTEIATHHLNGLEHLLRLRAVLHTKSMSGLIHRMILLADTLTSSATNCQPRFSGIVFNDADATSRRSSASTFGSASDPTSRSSTAPSSILSHRITPGFLRGVDADIAQVFYDLQYLCGQAAANDRATLVGDPSLPSELTSSICTAEKQIDILIHERIEKVDTNEHRLEFAAPVLENGSTVPVGACARSATIFIYLFLRRIPIHSPLFDWMVDLTQQDFERTEECIQRLYPAELLFWILYVAATASLGKPERSWFRMKLSKYRVSLKLNTWRAAKQVLERLAWLDTPGEILGGSLWEELEGDHWTSL